jgi:hypothetical protein
MQSASRIRAQVTELDTSRLVKKYPNLVLEEWDFSDCPNQELTECWLYEYKRESPHAHQVILNWRQTCKVKTFDEFLWLVRTTLTTIQYERLYALCPEWPAHPFLSIIPPAERTRRLKLLFPDEAKSRAAQSTPPPPMPGELPLAVVNFIQELLGLEKELQDVTFRIRWQKSDRENLSYVAAWLKIERRCKAKSNVSNRSLRADLKALGAYRILKATGGDWRNASPIYVEHGEWIKADARAKSIIARIDTL